MTPFEKMEELLQGNTIEAFVFHREARLGSVSMMVKPTCFHGYAPALHFTGRDLEEAWRYFLNSKPERIQERIALTPYESLDSSYFDNYLSNLNLKGKT